jgi:hypothetical protein
MKAYGRRHHTAATTQERHHGPDSSWRAQRDRQQDIEQTGRTIAGLGSSNAQLASRLPLGRSPNDLLPVAHPSTKRKFAPPDCGGFAVDSRWISRPLRWICGASSAEHHQTWVNGLTPSPTFLGPFPLVRWCSPKLSLSGRPDSNRGPRRPERRALPGCATPRRISQYPTPLPSCSICSPLSSRA